MQKMVQQAVDRFKAAPKDKRKEMLMAIPEDRRAGFKQILKANGVEVPE